MDNVQLTLTLAVIGHDTKVMVSFNPMHDSAGKLLGPAAGEIRQVVLDMARAELFAPFGELRKRQTMTSGDIRHLTGCEAPAILWGTRSNPVLADKEIATLTRVREIANGVQMHPWVREVVSVSARIHSGSCKRCGAEAAEVSALVSIPWAGHVLSREYLL